MKTTILAMTFVTVFGVAPAQSDQIPDQAKVSLDDGRVLSGSIYLTDNSRSLDLVMLRPGIALTTTISLARIREITVGGKTVSLADYLRKSGRVRDAQESSRPSRRAGRAFELPTASRASGVEHIDVVVRSANWDSDPDVDGLELSFRVHDSKRNVVSIPGQLSVQMTGLVHPDAEGEYAASRANAVRILESWSMRVSARDFIDGVAVVKLPYRKISPQHDVHIAPWVAAEVSYAVSSQGVFRASITDIAFRVPSLFRDSLYLSTGRRTLQSESINSTQPLHGNRLLHGRTQ